MSDLRTALERLLEAAEAVPPIADWYDLDAAIEQAHEALSVTGTPTPREGIDARANRLHRARREAPKQSNGARAPIGAGAVTGTPTHLDATVARVIAALPEGWAWECGDAPFGLFWAQAIGPERDHVHPRIWTDNHATVSAALTALAERLATGDEPRKEEK